jgi:hypothetical protein
VDFIDYYKGCYYIMMVDMVMKFFLGSGHGWYLCIEGGIWWLGDRYVFGVVFIWRKYKMIVDICWSYDIVLE